MTRPAARSPAILAIFLLTLLAPTVGADQQSEPPVPVIELDRHPGEGERCIVCEQQIHGHEIVELRYKGRRFFVAAEMLGEFNGDPDVYFQKLQARSALFDERSMEGRGGEC